MDDKVYPYTIYIREKNGWYKPINRSFHAHNADEAAQLFTEAEYGQRVTGGSRIAVESNFYKVFKVFQIKPMQQFEIIPV